MGELGDESDENLEEEGGVEAEHDEEIQVPNYFSWSLRILNSGEGVARGGAKSGVPQRWVVSDMSHSSDPK